MLLKQLWMAGWQAHDRLGKLVWCAGWTIPVVVLVLAISLPFWRNVASETRYMIVQQIDYEDSALCAKFGFVVNSVQYSSCKLDLLELRRSHEKLLDAGAMP